MLFFPTVDEDVAYFRSQGYTGSINDMHYKAMGDLGYTGSLNDRIHAFLTFKYGSFYEAMRDLRNGTSVFSLISAYGINGLDPALVFDFTEDYFRTAGTDTTFDSAITHAATTNATMVDSDGLLKWRPHNLLTYSEQFDNAAWLKFGLGAFGSGSVVDAIAAPSGAVTADLLTENSSTGVHLAVTTAVNFYDTAKTFSVYAKANGRRYIGVAAIASDTGQVGVFDLQTGTYVGAVDAPNGGTGVNILSTSIRDEGNGWYRCSVSFDVATATRFPALYLMNGTATANASYAGDGTSGIYIWGAQLNRSDLGGMVNNPDRGDSYVPTTTAARYLPRRGHHVYNGSEWVNEGLLHESDARTNLFNYSEDLSNAIWVARSFTKVGTAAGPFGITAYEFLEDSSSVNPAIYYDATVTDGTPRAFGVWLKASSPVTMALSTQGGTKSTDISVTTDWAFYWISDSLSSSSGAHIGGFSTLSVGSGIRIWVAMPQIEEGSTPSSYIPTAGATATRAAETLTVPAANMPWPTPVVIGEELVTNGTFDTNISGWTNNSDWWEFSASKAYHPSTSSYYGLEQDVGMVSGKTYLISFDLSGATGTLRLSQRNTIGGSSTKNYDFSGDTTHTQFISGSDGPVISFGRSVSFEGSIDNISVKEINPLSVSIQMDGLMTYADNGVGAEVLPFNWQNGQNYIALRINTVSTLTGRPQFLQKDGATEDIVQGAPDAYSPDINVPFNIASRHGSTFVNGATDGTALTANTTPTALADLSATNFSLGTTYNGTIGKLRVWSDDIDDTGIAEAST